LKKLIIFLFVALVALSSYPAFAGTAKQVDFLLNGYRHPTSDAILDGGKVYTYLDGTSTLSGLFTDKDQGGDASNPVILGSDGRAEVYGSGIYKFRVYDSDDVFVEELTGLNYQTSVSTVSLDDTYSCDIAAAVAGSPTSTIVVDCEFTVASGTTVTAPATSTLQYVRGGIGIGVTAGGTELLAVKGGFICPDDQQCVGADLAVTLPAHVQVSAMWGGALSDGSNDDTVELQLMADAMTSGGTFYVPKGSSFYKISDAIDFDVAGNITVEFENGAEVKQTVTNKHGFNTDQDWVTFDGATMQGLGTYITDSSIANTQGLVNTTGEHTTIKNCYIKEPEESGIKVDGAYAIIENCTIEGGPYFANAGEIGTDRQHYGIFITDNGDFATVTASTIKENSEANAGKVIQGISSATIATDLTVTENKILNNWDHALYLVTEGSEVNENICREGGIKLEMRASGVSTRGNTAIGNNIDVDYLSGPLAGDACMTLINPKWSTFSLNVGLNCQDDGITMDADSPYVITGNTFIGNIIDGVVDGAGSDATGFSADNTSIVTYSHNVFANNIAKNLGDDIDGANAGFHIDLADNDNHIGNIFSGNIVSGSQENGMLLNHLTGAVISGGSFDTIGEGAGSAAIEGADLQRCKIIGVHFEGDANMTYAYRESSSDFNSITESTFYNMATAAVRQSGLGANTLIKDNTLGTGFVSTDSTAGARTILVADLWLTTHLRDPNGAARTDTTDTGTNICTKLLFNDGATHTITYMNTGVAAETITIAGGAGVTVYNNEGAADAVIVAGAGAILQFVRTAANTVSLFVTVFEAV